MLSSSVLEHYTILALYLKTYQTLIQMMSSFSEHKSHSPMIPCIFMIYNVPYYGSCTARQCWLEVPHNRSSTSRTSWIAISNELGAGVQLNCDGLDPTHGLNAVDVARLCR
jgi:hypothetical protein